MQLIISHLTRMRAPHICTAGYELMRDYQHETALSGKRVRPTVQGQIHADLLSIFRLGAVVDIGNTICEGQPPEVEDHRFQPEQARFIQQVDAETFWSILLANALHTLEDIFGLGLQRKGWKAFLPAGSGQQSLGELNLTTKPILVVDSMQDRAKLRLILQEGTLKYDLPVTDVRFYTLNQWELNTDIVAEVASLIQQSESVILSVGLTRPFAPDSESEQVHWLQVNNIFPSNNPLWLGSLEEI